MNRTFGELIGLRIVLTRILVREAEATGNPTQFLKNERAVCLADLAGAHITTDTPTEGDTLRKEGAATISTIFDGIGVT